MSRRGKYARMRPRSTFQSRVKKVLMKTAETKKYVIGIENHQLYHMMGSSSLSPTSIATFFNPWSNIQKGTSRFNRIGDMIQPRGMSLKMWLSTKGDRPNTIFRVIVAILPKTYPGLLGAVTPTTYTFDPFEQTHNLGDVQNTLITAADTDKGVRFLYDRIHTVPGPYENPGSRETHKVIKLWIKRKRSRNIIFDSDRDGFISNKPLAIYVIPYEQFSTLTTDNIASCAAEMRLYYKDI